MDFAHYTDSSVRAAADLVNTKGSITGNEYLATPNAVREFLVDHDFSDVGRVTERDIRGLHAVRDRLRDVFFAPDDDTAGELLNRYLEELDVKPHLTDHDGHWHLHYVSDDAPLPRRVASVCAMGLATVLAESGSVRFGVCAADGCSDVFVDMSRNRSRRYCNEICSTRMNVAAHRARAKAQTP
jgi:hypothetical protein